ncbi:MFS transporter [Arachnia propionica]|uniref:MFS transporter n=1 Tax=Arachnia propionica TaxID=1750 RepID=UPI001639C001|nr:MFS transporter [Arachnia propionica]
MDQDKTEPDSRSGLLIGILLAVFGVAFQMVGVVAALPDVMRALDGEAHYAWAFSGMVMGMLLSLLVAGPYADRRGPLRPMTVGFALFLLGLVGAMVAIDVPTLIGARILQGLGGGAMNLSLFVVIALGFPGSRRPTVMSWLSLCWVLPAFVGPPISALLVQVNWRLVFVLGIPILMAAALLMTPQVKRLQAGFQPAEGRTRNPAWAVAVVSVSPALLQLTGILPLPWSIASGVAAVLGLLIAVPAVLPERVRSLRQGLGPMAATRALQAGAFFAAEAFLLVGLQDLRGLNGLQAGVALTIGSLGWSCGSWLQSRSWLRLRRDQIITLGTGLGVLGIAGLTTFMVWTWVPIVVAVFAWAIAGCGMGLMMASTAVATMALSSPQEQGRNSSALQVSETLGNSLLTAAAGAVHAGLLARGLPSLGWVFLVLLLAIVTALGLSLRTGPIRDEVPAGGR